MTRPARRRDDPIRGGPVLQAILNTLYLREFARRKIFFRRLRMPPVFCTVWDRILVSHAIRRYARLFVQDWETSLREAEHGVNAVRHMIELARIHGIPDQGLELELDTFTILLAARKYFFEPFTPDRARELERLKEAYATKYKQRYRVRLDFKRTRLKKHHFRLLHLLLFRERRGYRLIDHVLALRLLPLAYPVIAFAIRRLMPKSLREQAMGADVLFR
ncbi:MAG: hypothetical protein RRC34_03445 [Lentisphaeria bacterium]|nr:hypothetical protein [Lentisphaeria bacterium]